MKKRQKLEIIKDILEIVKNKREIKHTPLLRKSNLSSARFKEYYADLINKELIKTTNEDKGKKIILTEKGQRFLEKYVAIVHFIDEFEL